VRFIVRPPSLIEYWNLDPFLLYEECKDNKKMSQVDASEIDRLSEAIGRILPALEDFNHFQGQDLAGRQRSTWMTALNQPLPERGVGLDQVLRELTETIIPHGLRIGSPGFCGWVTTAPTTAGTAAALAATVAGSQRYFIQPFSYLETVALRWLAELLGLPSDLQGTFTICGQSCWPWSGAPTGVRTSRPRPCPRWLASRLTLGRVRQQ
jgi:hypothetical protein